MASLMGTLTGLFYLCHLVVAVPVLEQIPLSPGLESQGKPLHGRFLHISDLHPDPHYKYHSSVAEDSACHRGKGPAGHYGAETTSCDSPYSLINATFDWIGENLKDTIDFVIWTGDSARHDNDEALPRDEKEIQSLNRYAVSKFVDVFGDKKGDLSIPVVPTWGNNDVLPHNIFYPGPNKWTRSFLDIWRRFIPESQRHAFEYGGWFWSEVIPNKLAVLSVNSLYFADNNAAVDGCADRRQPGYAQFEWLRIQLQLMRKRGMKAIIIGHQAPARTESKKSWDETCWQKYTLWLHQYRDIIVGTAWGHMNIDHFMLQDIQDVDIAAIDGEETSVRTALEDEITVQGTTDYLTELRQLWHKLPNSPKKLQTAKRKEKDKFYKKIGGPYGERYSLSLVTPSVVPNYYPTLRVVEYNVSMFDSQILRADEDQEEDLPLAIDISKNKNKFKIPRSPSKSAPPGPAYSPQTFTWLKYTQYYSNLTTINNDFHSTRWKEGKYRDEEPESSPEPKKLTFEVEYDTRDDNVYSMKDLTVMSWLKLAETIGKYKPVKKVAIGTKGSSADDSSQEAETTDHGKKKKDKKHKKKKDKKHHKQKRKLVNKVWHTFIRRAFVGAVDDADLEDNFGRPVKD